MKDEAEMTGDRQQAAGVASPVLICISLLEALKLMTYVEGAANTPIALNAFQSELFGRVRRKRFQYLLVMLRKYRYFKSKLKCDNTAYA